MIRYRIIAFIIAVFVAALAHAQVAPETRAPAIAPAQSVLAHNGMVVAQESRAARIGITILDRGGNAVDAAVATGFALAVTYPRAGNIGGGGFMVIHLAKGNRDTTIDYRETAPAAATATMFLDAQGNPDPAKSRDSALAVGVPGTVAGLAMALAKYGSGKFTLADLIAPALDLAQKGFPVEDDLADSLPGARDRLGRWPSSAAIFLNGGDALHEGDRLIQPDLADTLRAIAKDGPRAFYSGRVAEKIAAAVQKAGGIMTADDLAHYKAIERPALRGSYRGYDIVSMPPPSSGGVALIEMLNILEGFDLAKLARAEALHDEIEAMKRAYADRAVYHGRSRQRENADRRADLEILRCDAARADRRPRDARRRRAGLASRRNRKAAIPRISPSSTATATRCPTPTTLNFGYGIGLVADGTGVLLNNELDDFTAKPGAPTPTACSATTPTCPVPNKRPLSSMTPTIVLKDGKPVLVTGSPGGSRIITTVLQVVVNVIDFDMPVAQAVTAPRLHHQWQPDATFAEPGFDPDLLDALRARGHNMVPTAPHTSANSISVIPKSEFTPQGYVGAADRRTRGSLAAGY